MSIDGYAYLEELLPLLQLFVPKGLLGWWLSCCREEELPEVTEDVDNVTDKVSTNWGASGMSECFAGSVLEQQSLLEKAQKLDESVKDFNTLSSEERHPWNVWDSWNQLEKVTKVRKFWILYSPRRVEIFQVPTSEIFVMLGAQSHVWDWDNSTFYGAQKSNPQPLNPKGDYSFATNKIMLCFWYWNIVLICFYSFHSHVSSMYFDLVHISNSQHFISSIAP